MSKKPTTFALVLAPREPGTGAARWLCDALRTEIPEGRLHPGAQLPARRLRRATTSHLLGCGPMGYRPLQEAVADYLRTSRGVKCAAEQVAIVSGVQEALALAARVFLNPGDRVCLEDPGYPGVEVSPLSRYSRGPVAKDCGSGSRPWTPERSGAELGSSPPFWKRPGADPRPEARGGAKLLVWSPAPNRAIFPSGSSDSRPNGRASAGFERIAHLPRAPPCRLRASSTPAPTPTTTSWASRSRCASVRTASATAWARSWSWIAG